MRETEILNAAEQLFLKKGFSKTTISHIAEACELTNGAIYLYFKNKNEIILIIMTKISNSFADLLVAADDPSKQAIERAEKLFHVYRETFSKHNNYHVLDAQFNIIFDKSYPETPYLEKYYKANRRVLDVFISLFEAGFKDRTIRVPNGTGLQDPRKSAYMFLNVINSYVEKICLRKDLMESEQDISMKEELFDFLDFLIQSLRAS